MKKILMIAGMFLGLAACAPNNPNSTTYSLKSSTCSAPPTHIQLEDSDFKTQGQYTLKIFQSGAPFSSCNFTAKADLQIGANTYTSSNIRKSFEGSCYTSLFRWDEVYDYSTQGDLLTLSNNGCILTFQKR